MLVVASALAGGACDKRSALSNRDAATSPGTGGTGGTIGGGHDAGSPVEAGATTGGAGSPVDGGAIGGGGGAQGGAAGADGGIGPGSNCTSDIGTRVPPAQLRRLSNFAYGNTVRDVLGLSPLPIALPAAGDAWQDDAATLTALTDAFHGIAHDFALAATKDAASASAFSRCDPGALAESTCAQRFIADFIPRMFRRPLDTEDAADFAAVFAKGRDLGGNYASGVRAVIEVAMQSPEFLYMVEFGEALAPPQAGLGRPRPYEMAARLSYLLRGSAPDNALTDAAANDLLRTKEQIAEQARRLLADARAHDVTRDFYARLLRLGDLASRNSIPSATAQSAAEETNRFVEQVVWNEGGDFGTLLKAPFTFADQTLAQLYEIPGVTGTGFQRVTLPAQRRQGVLTQVSLLASRSLTSPRETHPSARGALIFEQFLCGDLTQTPSADQHTKPPPNPGETPRQWLERVTAPAACRSCHQAIDPLGLAFEHYAYDAIWRDADGGLALDARGTVGGIDTAGSFDGAIQLIARLAPSRDVQACHVRKWMETAYGRPVAAADVCSRAELEQGFASSGGDIRDLLIRLTQTEAFLYRPAP